MTGPDHSHPNGIVGIYRYPVKSMLGEELDVVTVGERGVLGDRAFALLDADTGKIASAANPRKWAALYDCRASFEEQPCVDQPLPAVRMTLPTGETLTSTQRDCDSVLSRALGRATTLVAAPPPQASYEIYWPEVSGVVPMGEPVANAEEETITALPVAFAAPPDTFFDGAVIHLLTTATLRRLHDLYPAGQFDTRRFRPNIVVEFGANAEGFIENEWIGRTLALGDELRLRVLMPCPRCVRPTLAQGDLPKDLGILRTLAQHNLIPVGDYGRMACAGVYCDVVRPGHIRRGDMIKLA